MLLSVKATPKLMSSAVCLHLFVFVPASVRKYLLRKGHEQVTGIQWGSTQAGKRAF
jgi:hypothetical protein